MTIYRRRVVAGAGLLLCLLLLVVSAAFVPSAAASPELQATVTQIPVGGDSCGAVEACVTVPILWGPYVAIFVTAALVLLVYGLWRMLTGVAGV